MSFQSLSKPAQDTVRDVFAHQPEDVQELLVTEDGQCFHLHNAGAARTHATSIAQQGQPGTVLTVNRADTVVKAKKPAETATTPPADTNPPGGEGEGTGKKATK